MTAIMSANPGLPIDPQPFKPEDQSIASRNEFDEVDLYLNSLTDEERYALSLNLLVMQVVKEAFESLEADLERGSDSDADFVLEVIEFCPEDAETQETNEEEAPAKAPVENAEEIDLADTIEEEAPAKASSVSKLKVAATATAVTLAAIAAGVFIKNGCDLNQTHAAIGNFGNNALQGATNAYSTYAPSLESLKNLLPSQKTVNDLWEQGLNYMPRMPYRI
jgi:hypothetical protein